MPKLLLLFTLITTSFAFSTSNIQYLYGSFDGNSYVFDTKNGGKHTVTIEHYTALEYGDVFAFIDACMADHEYKYHDDKYDFYGEISPRINLSTLTQSDLSLGVLKQLYIAGQYNAGENFNAVLYGLGSDLNIPGFNVFGLNLYVKDQNIGENTYQLSSAYTSKKLFSKLYLNGFVDWTEYDLLTQNQFLFAVTDSFDIGAEWHYYKQKPIDINFNSNVESNSLQAMLRYSW